MLYWQVMYQRNSLSSGKGWKRMMQDKVRIVGILFQMRLTSCWHMQHFLDLCRIEVAPMALGLSMPWSRTSNVTHTSE